MSDTDTVIDQLNEAAEVTPDGDALLAAAFDKTFGTDTSDVVDPSEVDEVVETPAVDDVPAPDDAVTPISDTPQGYTVKLADGSTATFQEDQIRQMAEVTAWAQALDDETRQAMSAIESRRAKAVELQEWEQYEAWKATRPQAQAQTADVWADVIQDLDPEHRDAFLQLQRDAEAGRRAQSQPSPELVAREAIALESKAQRREMEFMSATNAWADERGLTGEEATSLLNVAIQAGAVGQFIERNRRLSPTGQELSVDVTAAARQSLDFALMQNPELHTRVLSPQSSVTTPSNDAVSAKKARAASVASAPSASVSQPPSDPRQMTEQQRHASMADFIRNSTGN